MTVRRMRAHVLHAPGHMSFEEKPVPSVGVDDVLLRVDAVLTCGTDLKAFRRGHPIIPLPMVVGHEYSGTVVAAGRNVKKFREGDRVATVHSGPCLECAYCRRGRENLCETITHGMVWGGYAEYVRLPAHVHRSNTLQIPDGLTLERVAFLEPVACVLHGLAALDLERVGLAVVLGAGPMGLLFVQMLKAQGVENVVMVGKRVDRLAKAQSLGASMVIDIEREDATARIRDLTNGYGADVVIECVGRTEAWESAVGLVARGGQVLFYGGCPADSRVSLPTGRLHYDELTLLGTFHFTRADVREAFEILREGSIDVDSLISGTYGLEDVPLAFDRLTRGEGIKYLISPHIESKASKTPVSAGS